MKTYVVRYHEYETDCRNYTYDSTYPSFEEAQNAVEETFWRIIKQGKYEGIDYLEGKNVYSGNKYKIEVTKSLYLISGDWEFFRAEIREVEVIQNHLDTGLWKYVDTDGYPEYEGEYFCSILPEEWDTVQKEPYTAYVSYTKEPEYRTGRHFMFDEYGTYPNVYAWTEMIAPARL